MCVIHINDLLGMTYLLNNIVLLQYTQYCNNNKHATPESSSKQFKTAEGKSSPDTMVELLKSDSDFLIPTISDSATPSDGNENIETPSDGTVTNKQRYAWRQRALQRRE